MDYYFYIASAVISFFLFVSIEIFYPTVNKQNIIDKKKKRFWSIFVTSISLLLALVLSFNVSFIFSVEKKIGDVEKKIDDVKPVAISNEIVLYNALQRPFKGKWSYRVDWDEFHGEPKSKTNSFVSNGDAFFLWVNSGEHFKYEICIGYEISNNVYNKERTVVVAYLVGEWETDINGLPLENEFELKYGERMGIEKYSTASSTMVKFENVKYIRGENNKIHKITADYNFASSKGKVTFKRR